MTADRFTLIAAALLGHAWPALPELPGRVHVCFDRPLTTDEMVGINTTTELALVLGISRQAAWQRLQRTSISTPPAAAGQRREASSLAGGEPSK